MSAFRTQRESFHPSSSFRRPGAIIRSYHFLKNEIVESNIRWVTFKWWKSATREYDIFKQTYFVCWINVKMLSQIKLLLLALVIRFYNGHERNFGKARSFKC